VPGGEAYTTMAGWVFEPWNITSLTLGNLDPGDARVLNWGEFPGRCQEKQLSLQSPALLGYGSN
jgi:hypothetical protein